MSTWIVVSAIMCGWGAGVILGFYLCVILSHVPRSGDR